jgi:hypothetical protein
MAEFTNADMHGSRFSDVDLSGTRFQNVDLTGVKIRGALLADVDISGWVKSMRINDVEVGPLIEAELDRRYPERTKLRPSDADGFREAWAVIERLWASTVERARRLPPDQLHERVDGEWSFIETLRHLVFATDAWVRRTVLGEPSPYDALDLPHTEMPDEPGVPRDHTARPTLDEILALRADRMAGVREVMAGLTDDRLAGSTEPVPPPGYPPTESYAVHRCLQTVVLEEWEHRRYAERDLAVLEAKAAAGVS